MNTPGSRGGASCMDHCWHTAYSDGILNNCSTLHRIADMGWSIGLHTIGKDTTVKSSGTYFSWMLGKVKQCRESSSMGKLSHGLWVVTWVGQLAWSWRERGLVGNRKLWIRSGSPWIRRTPLWAGATVSPLTVPGGTHPPLPMGGRWRDKPPPAQSL